MYRFAAIHALRCAWVWYNWRCMRHTIRALWRAARAAGVMDHRCGNNLKRLSELSLMSRPPDRRVRAARRQRSVSHRIADVAWRGCSSRALGGQSLILL